MVVQLRPRSITVDRGSRGFGLSLIYRGLDKYDEKDTGIFVARVVPGGQAARFGVRENDKILTINGKTPRNVDDAVAVIKAAGNQIKLVVLREEDVPEASTPIDNRQDMDAHWASDTFDVMRDTIGQQPISRSGSARSFNTTFGRNNASTPSPKAQRSAFAASSGPHSMVSPPSPSPSNARQQEFLRQQQEYRRQQEEAERQLQLQQQQQQQQQYQQQQQQYQPHQNFSAKDTVRDLIANTDFSSFDLQPRQPGQRIVQNGGNQETRKSTENMTRIVQESVPRPSTSQSGRYKSTNSLHELGLDNYPNPEYPESTRLSRKEEKQSLQNLNNRLAGYIDRVRQLQNENARLTHQIKTVESYQAREVSGVKDMYEKQIEELKSALDAVNKQYNQLKVSAEGLLAENEDLRDKVQKRDKEVNAAQGRASDLEEEVRKLNAKLAKMEQERQRAQDELKELSPEVESLRRKLADAKRQVDDEQLKSADLANKCARLEEDLKFKMKMLENELTEVKQRKEIEITQIDGKLQEEYEDRLQKALEELRAVYDKQMRQSREDFEKLYDDRVKELQAQLSNERGNNASSAQELKESRSRVEALIRKLSDLENANLALNQKIADMAQELDDLKSSHRSQMAAKDDEIKRLLDELASQLKQYQNLQDVKVALDMEIAVFRRLIECEEDRLGMTEKSLNTSRSSSSSDRSHVKTTVERSSDSTFQKKITVSQTQL